MALPRVVDNLDQIDEAYRSLYQERDGKFHFSVDVEPSDDDRKRVAEVARKEREARAAADKKAEELAGELTKIKEDLGDIDPEKLRELIAKHTEEEGKRVKTHEEFQETIRRKDEKHAAELKKATEPRDAEIARLRQALDQRDFDKEMHSVAEKLNVDPEMAQVWRDHMRLRARMEAEGENGSEQRRLVVDVDGVPIPFEEWAVKHWSTEKIADRFRLQKQNTGGAQDAGRGFGGTPNPWRKETYNRTEQHKMLRDNPAMARSMAQQAGAKIATE